jgi:hypothetical protein
MYLGVIVLHVAWKGILHQQPREAKIAFLATRVQLLDITVYNDLNFLPAIGDSDIKLIKMACEQTAYTAVKRTPL